MAFRKALRTPSRFGQFFRTNTSNVAEIGKAKESEVTEQVKEQILDRWAKYWKNLYIDYKEVGLDIVRGCKERPIRASIYFTRTLKVNLVSEFDVIKGKKKYLYIGRSGSSNNENSFDSSVLGGSYYFAKQNPDGNSYRETLIEYSNKLMMVGEPIRNPITRAHLKSIEQCYNEGIIRRLSLGVVSFIWLDNYEKECANYKATCSYLKPEYFGFHHRIVDVGFMNKWWMLEDKMKNYDINETEFNKSVDSLVTAKSSD